MTEQTSRTSRKRILRQGVVTSDKMDKTISVRMDRKTKHPLYGKYVKRKTIFKAHDPDNTAFEGDIVEIEFCRPYSKTKRWRLVRVVKQGPASIESMESGETAAPAAVPAASEEGSAS